MKLCLLVTLIMLFTQLLQGQNSSFILSTEKFDPYFPTCLGNGYFSLSSSPLGTGPAESFMVWVYDHGEGDIPRIAALPEWNEIDFYNGQNWLNSAAPDANAFPNYRQTLDMLNSRLITEYDWLDAGKRASISVETLVSGNFPNLAAIKFRLTPHFSGPLKISFPLQERPEPQRLALARLEKYDPAWTTDSIWYPGHLEMQDQGMETASESGSLWMISRAEGRPTTIVGQAVTLQWPENLPGAEIRTNLTGTGVSLEVSLTAQAESSYTFYKYIGAASSHDYPNPLEKAKQTALMGKTLGFDSIFAQHARFWQKRWETDIIIEGDPALQQLVHSMIFYLLGSVREGTDFSISPMGLCTAGYYGHIFWDADIYMFPPLALMYPQMAKSMVMFRYHTLQAAQLNARLNGYKGAMYPWESDEIGNETTPEFAGQNAQYEVHITGNVAIAQWQYFLASGDSAWLAQYGWPVIKEAADFWTSRVTPNREKDRYEIKNVVSVDEGRIGVDNEAYTNAVAKRTLEIALKASQLLQQEPDPQWREIAEKMFIPFDESGQYHLTYEGAPPELTGGVVALLIYPLGLEMSEAAKRNNFENAITRAEEEGLGAMMGSTFFSIIAAEIGEKDQLNKIFPGWYQGYLRPPFNVLAETPGNNSINFLTGAGAYLQQFIYGFTGLRLSEKGVEEKSPPLLPRSIKKMILKNFTIRGKQYDIIVEKDRLRLAEIAQ